MTSKTSQTSSKTQESTSLIRRTGVGRDTAEARDKVMDNLARSSTFESRAMLFVNVQGIIFSLSTPSSSRVRASFGLFVAFAAIDHLATQFVCVSNALCLP